MIKIMLLLGMMVCSTSTGWYIRKVMASRKNYFDDLVKFCSHLKQNIESKKDKISVFVMQNERLYGKEFYEDLKGYFLEHKGVSHLYLKEREKKEIETFFGRLGTLTIKEELDNIQTYQTIFEDIQKSSTKVLNQYGTLSLKLSSLLGAILCILLF